MSSSLAMPAALTWHVWCAVAVGGLAGTELRYLLGLLLIEEPGAFPWTTLAVNVSGSLLLGCLTARWTIRPQTPFWLRAGLGPGLLGSFTTFSAVSLALFERIPGPEFFLYLGASVIFGFSAAAAGLALGRRAGGAR